MSHDPTNFRSENMIFNLLLDLDDTLLNSNIDVFLSAYFKKLAIYMADIVPPEQFTMALLRSTKIMYENTRPDQTLEQTFNNNFYPSLGVDQHVLAEKIEKFYDDVFPALSSLTTPRPEAIKLVEWAFSQGWNVSIATDPLFPRKAILHRLRWAGLAPEKYPFTLISDFQRFHFAKASVAYYPEFLAQMNWLDSPVLMVGDSMERDVLPSRAAGLPVFWLNMGEDGSRYDGPQGNFENLKNYLESRDLSSIKVNYSSPMAMIAFLQATPAVLHSIMFSSSSENLGVRPRDGEWSLREVLCHMRDVDQEVNIKRVESILSEENVFIHGQATDQWTVERHYQDQDGQTAFRDFVAVRVRLIEILSGLNSEDWDRRARHTFLGPTTLREMVEIMVDHDRLHLSQASALVW